MVARTQKTRLTWFDTGYAEAKQGLPSDPPQYPGHGAYKNYRDGYQCAEHEMELEADRENSLARPTDDRDYDWTNG